MVHEFQYTVVHDDSILFAIITVAPAVTWMRILFLVSISVYRISPTGFQPEQRTKTHPQNFNYNQLGVNDRIPICVSMILFGMKC